MQPRTPITIITGPLGSGKTTLLRQILDSTSRRLAIIVNEFGEVAIDSKIIEGKDIRMAELTGGCVCCSLTGEFEAAVKELMDRAHPDQMVLETTGVAEPGALTFDIQENLPQVRVDGVISIMDADGLLRFPSLGHTGRMQVESADLLLLNKIDLVREGDLEGLEGKLQAINPTAHIIRTQRCRVNAEVLFGLSQSRPAAGRELSSPGQTHHPEFDSFSYSCPEVYGRQRFEEFAASLAPDVFRAKGFVRFPEGTHLFNYIAGRWDLEPFDRKGVELVFIGKHLAPKKSKILDGLRACKSP
ncbi:MAG TPA: GTP-binding protein [Clostridia bacterium]|nr:GTP-binding protein [Clostridia bacterium]